MYRLLSVVAIAASLSSLVPVQADAQGQDWFVPGQGRAPRVGAASGPATSRQPRTLPARAPSAQPEQGQLAQPANDPGAPGGDPSGPRLQVALPTPPVLPPLAKGVPPPTAIIGVLGVPDVMRGSLAAQQVERTISERRTKWQQDAQKEQASWRELQQTFASQRQTMTPDQVRTRERELQERITKAQREFKDRERVIQDATQFGVAQIEQTMVSVIRQVAESRGMNIVLHRAQVALNINEFDLTQQVTEQLNKVLPTVQIPADGAPVPTMAAAPPAGPPQATAQAASPPAPPVTPAAAPGPRASTPPATPAAVKP